MATTIRLGSLLGDAKQEACLVRITGIHPGLVSGTPGTSLFLTAAFSGMKRVKRLIVAPRVSPPPCVHADGGAAAAAAGAGADGSRQGGTQPGAAPERRGCGRRQRCQGAAAGGGGQPHPFAQGVWAAQHCRGAVSGASGVWLVWFGLVQGPVGAAVVCGWLDGRPQGSTAVPVALVRQYCSSAAAVVLGAGQSPFAWALRPPTASCVSAQVCTRGACSVVETPLAWLPRHLLLLFQPVFCMAAAGMTPTGTMAPAPSTAAPPTCPWPPWPPRCAAPPPPAAAGAEASQQRLLRWLLQRPRPRGCPPRLQQRRAPAAAAATPPLLGLSWPSLGLGLLRPARRQGQAAAAAAARRGQAAAAARRVAAAA